MMGTIYFIGCRDCKIYRDIDKFYAMRDVKDRKEALELARDLQNVGYSFRAALLVSFMWRHKGHNCTVFNEHDDSIWDEFLNPSDDTELENDPKREPDIFWNKSS